MLKKFTVKNYKNFKDEISIEFDKTAGYQFSTDCVYGGLISKMLIYGRNATGKTNLGKAVMDIYGLLFDGPSPIKTGTLLNADSEEEAAMFSYEFQFGEDEIIYRYSRLEDGDLNEEELIINNKILFKCEFKNNIYQFDDLGAIGVSSARQLMYARELMSANGKEKRPEFRMAFLRWLIGNVLLTGDSVIKQLENYVTGMTYITTIKTGLFGFALPNVNLLKVLKEKERLQHFEEYLNMMGVECQLVLRELPDGKNELYFKHKKLIPFYSNASSGTLAAVDLYWKLFSNTKDLSFIYLDEFDAFYHYEMAENMIKFFKKKYPKCQMIITSHNTNLMTNRLMRPDCMFILSTAGTLTSLCNATSRELREGHNLEKMYISGEFEKYE